MVENKINVKFVANNSYVEHNVPENISQIVSGRDFVAWGRDNQYPTFLNELYNNSPTLHSVINGITDFVVGNEIKTENKKDITDVVINVVRDYLVYGVAYINVLRNVFNQVVEIKHLDTRDVRTNENCDVFFYSKDFTKNKWGRIKTIAIPKYDENNDAKSSVLMIKNTNRDIYDAPLYTASINSVLTEIKIQSFHLNEISNNFNASGIINFNNNIPTTEEVEEFERLINEKFCGEGNVGRFILSFNKDKENATTFERIVTDDFADRYNTLEKSIRQNIFTSFRANPNLFGIPTESLGFSNEEYEESFRLFNRTTIRPIQKKIVREFAKVGYNLTIIPFSIDENNNKEENVN